MPRSSIRPTCRASRSNGIIASMQPVHQTSDCAMAEARMGLDRLRRRLCLAHACSTIACRSRSARISRSKAPIPSTASRRRSAARMRPGNPPGGWLPQQRLTMEQAFAAFTRGGAYAGFAEDRLGTLEPGRMADFLFIDRDIFEITDQRADPRDAGAGDLDRRPQGVGAARTGGAASAAERICSGPRPFASFPCRSAR